MKYLDIKGKTVMTCGGRTIGTVSDILVDFNHVCVLGAIVSTGSLLHGLYYMPLKNLRFYEHGIIAKAMAAPVKRSFLKQNNGLGMSGYMNREVRNLSNTVIGRLADMVFDSDTGEIQGVVVSKGFFEDVFEGRRLVITNGAKGNGNANSRVNSSVHVHGRGSDSTSTNGLVGVGVGVGANVNVNANGIRTCSNGLKLCDDCSVTNDVFYKKYMKE